MVRKGVLPVEATVKNSELWEALQTGRFLVSVGIDTPMGNRGRVESGFPLPTTISSESG